MDIACRFCGEPWDHDELHYMEAGGRALSYAAAGKRFSRYGCEAFNGEASPDPCKSGAVDSNAATYATAMQIVSDNPEEWGDF